MDNNIKILLVNCDDIEPVLNSINLKEITKTKNGKDAIKQFVEQPFSVTFVHELPAEEEQALISSMLEINPSHYVVTLTDHINPEKLKSFMQNGAHGILSQPFTAHKIKLELDKYDLFYPDTTEDEDERKAS